LARTDRAQAILDADQIALRASRERQAFLASGA
jgi:hypothetical protein